MTKESFDGAFSADFAGNREPQDLLPGNSTAFERAQSLTSDRILDTDVDAIRRERRAFDADPDFVPLLAAERGVHHPAGTEYERRKRVDESFVDHLSYGTPAALEQEIALDVGEPPENIRIREFWHEKDLVWPEFVVEALRDPGDPMPDLTPHLASATLRKNVRDWPKARAHYRHPPGRLYHGAAANISIRVRTVDARASNLKFGATMRALILQRTNA